MTSEQRHEAAMQALNASPSIAAILATRVLDLSVDTLLGLAGIAFIAVQGAYLLWRWRRDYKRDLQRDLQRRPPGQPPPETDRGEL